MRDRKNEWRYRFSVIVLLGCALISVAALWLSPAEAGLKSTCTSSTGASWDQNLSGACRFTVLADFGGAAVLDNNTGLVWEQAPNANARIFADTYGTPDAAIFYCVNKTVGGTRGWRLPSVVELTSLMDPSLSAPFVSASYFSGVQSSRYWAASQSSPGQPWYVDFSTGNANYNDINASNFSFLVWCVRGAAEAY